VRSKPLTYKDSGVDIAKGNAAAARIKKLVKQTYNKDVLNEVGLFGGFYSGKFPGLKQPVLISSTDSVGTKVKLAFMTGIHNTVGQDIVNHCTDDILVHGARPLFFLDYYATGRLDPNVVAEVVSGMVKACKENGCALIGGETAEMPAIYQPGEYDLAGFIVGVVDKKEIIDGKKIKPGNVVIGMTSTGPHTNGYSLARKLFFDKLKLKPTKYIDELGCTVAEALMAVHRSYLKPVMKLKDTVTIRGLAHITGGGIPGNLVRILPQGCRAVIDKSSWQVPPLYHFIQKNGSVADTVMFETFNMGIGMMAVVERNHADKALALLKKMRLESYIVGEIIKGDRKVVLK
jgi:phosphoribosylformylglycinamidine cyclo-ligase